MCICVHIHMHMKEDPHIGVFVHRHDLVIAAKRILQTTLVV